MRKTLVVTLCILVAMSTLTMAKKMPNKLDNAKFREAILSPANPPEIGGSMFHAAAAGTTVLGWWQFDSSTGQPDSAGWTVVDKYAQVTEYFHVDGNAGGDPACNGITPVNGAKSMWCGQWQTTATPWCSWATLPGYGNSWEQRLVSEVIDCDTLTWAWTAVWDSESGYDYTYAEYYDNLTMSWLALPINAGAEAYDGVGGPLSEAHQVITSGGSTQLRFHFVSDEAYSDQDGGWPSVEGAFKVDDIGIVATNGFSNGPQTFETETCQSKSSGDGFWTAQSAPGYGLYGALHSATGLVQEDPCLHPLSNMWGFFDDPLTTNYACGGWPLQGAMPYGPDANDLYMWNEIWSPWVQNQGSGSDYQIQFLSYRDLPLDNLQFYLWEVRGKDVSGCPSEWDTDWWVWMGGQKDWIRGVFQIGAFVPPGSVELQVAIGAIDMCYLWCGVYGTGACHSHAPILDQMYFYRVDFTGPQWDVRDIELFQDNFPENGEVVGFARCDMPRDMLPGDNGTILPGDSLLIQVIDPDGIGTDPTVGGPSVYLFAKVTDRHGTPIAGKSGVAIQSPDNIRFTGDPNAGTLRYPFVGPASAPAGLPAGWSQYRMDDAYSRIGGLQPDQYCCDLMDIANGNYVNENAPANVGIFTPGDVINYFLGAKNSLGQWSYFHRTYGGQGAANTTADINEAVQGAMEWSVLPDAGREPGDLGDILFVDDADDRGGPAQLYFDWAFRYMGIEDRVDRFDVIGPSSSVGNGLASRVKNVFAQIIGDPVEIYQKILWNSSDLRSGLIGDGGTANGGSGPEKTDSYDLLFTFLNHHPDNPGVYVAGDNIAEEWAGLIGAGAVNLKSTFMTHALTNGSHTAAGEPVSPLTTQSIGSPIGPASMYAYGGCPVINDFDVLMPTGSAFYAMEYEIPGHGGVIAQATPNAAETTARYVMSGFAYNYIRDDGLGATMPDRVAHLRDILIWFQNIIDDPIGIDPVAFENRLDNAYPNPFNPTTTIKYSIAERAHVTLKVYNAAGQLVHTLVDEAQAPSAEGFSKGWNGLNDKGQSVSSGVYFYKLTVSNGFSMTKKMVLLK